MQKYARIINEQTKQVEIGDGTDDAFYESTGMSLMEVEQAYDGGLYVQGYAPTEPEPTQEELAAKLRAERDRRITACDWLVQRNEEELIRNINTSLDIDTYEAWLDYRQELRNLPEQGGFPWDGGGEETPWPEEPTFDNTQEQLTEVS